MTLHIVTRPLAPLFSHIPSPNISKTLLWNIFYSVPPESLITTMSNTVRHDTHHQRKLFIQMSGAPGSGKSTLARLLAHSVDGVILNHDILRSTVLGHRIPFDEAAKLAYGLGWALAEEMIKQGRSVIIDSTCNYQEVVDRGSAMARQYGYDYWYVECKVDNINLLDERLCTRVPLRSQRRGVDSPPPDANGAVHTEDSRAVFNRWIKGPCRPVDNAISVDSTRRPEECRDYALRRMCPQSSV